ncbi:MAG: Proline iminopeptidase [Methanosaeta sp. PtaU1.Bin112]|nr:MAG: Proline iminopeptidase [Methanosaeta sp. PtaU1.Bin112]
MMLRILRWIAIGLISAMIIVSAAYLWDMNRSYDRISGKSTVIPSPCGDIEFSEGGSGPDVLVIHGSGGGYDQGELLAQATVGDQFHWIAPSRFGYLRSTFHEGATFDDQARAYAYLLDQLGIKKVAVVALSHGGPSALLFAVLYPQRVSSLTLVSCGVASSNETAQLDANQKGDTLTAIYRYDPLYWAATRIFRSQFLQLLGASGTVIAGLNPEQRELVDRIVDYMNPVSLRSAGVSFDNKAKMPDERIAAIKAPTLIFHATDDALQLYRNAQFAASTIPGSRLVSFKRGGHLLLAVEEPAIKNQTEKHILEHING